MKNEMLNFKILFMPPTSIFLPDVRGRRPKLQIQISPCVLMLGHKTESNAFHLFGNLLEGCVSSHQTRPQSIGSLFCLLWIDFCTTDSFSAPNIDSHLHSPRNPPPVTPCACVCVCVSLVFWSCYLLTTTVCNSTSKMRTFLAGPHNSKRVLEG